MVKANILCRDIFNAFAEAVSGQKAEGNRSRQSDLAQRIQARNVRFGLCLCIAQRLRLLQGGFIASARSALHLIQHVIRRSVQNPLNGNDLIRLPCQCKVVQKGDAASAGCGKKKGSAGSLCDLLQSDPILCHEHLIGRNKMLSACQRALCQ